MGDYQRILVLTTPDPLGMQVVRKGHQLARLHGASLALASLVEFDCGCESDHVPFQTPGEIQAAMVRETERRLRGMADRLGLGPETVVSARAGRGRRAAIALAGALRAELVVLGSHEPFDLLDAPSPFALFSRDPIPFDWMVARVTRPSTMGRLVGFLAPQPV
ncbi:MAG: universal stress protein [Magnetococcales bacterium]|nr:universal stress protein [Magnetococcales bacterium]